MTDTFEDFIKEKGWDYYPDTFKDFIEKNSWEDNTGAYNCKLIKVKDALDAWEHYTCSINSSINNIYECISMITRNVEDIEEIIE